jgi:tRNA (guanine-N7-)-methyltransferase
MSLSTVSRLPIWHSDYRYPPSRNPYWGKLQEFQNCAFSDHQTEDHRGNWRSRFPDLAQDPNRELHVEIGCNAGHVVVEWATNHPERAYIGMDWKFKPIFRGVEKSKKRNLKNLIFFRAHAERFASMFGNQEVDRLYLFFPDPWPRKSQWKHRFITKERLQQLSKIMKPSGIFHIKTDHSGYFEWIFEAVSQCPQEWEIVEISRDLHKDHPAPQELQIPDVTLFEKLFIKDGIPIKSLKLKPRV